MAVAASVLDISEITQFLNRDKSNSISQLIKDKPGHLQKLLKHFNGRITFASNISLSSGVLPIIVISY